MLALRTGAAIASFHLLSFGLAHWTAADSPILIAVTKEDIQAHFSKDGTGNITEVKLMNGFGFIEYDDPLDARDMVPGKSCDMLHSSWKSILTMSQLSVRSLPIVQLSLSDSSRRFGS